MHISNAVVVYTHFKDKLMVRQICSKKIGKWNRQREREREREREGGGGRKREREKRDR